MAEAPVLFEVRQAVGLATLNSEKTLNSLSLDMIDLLTGQLNAWRDDHNISVIVIRGAGDKAFSAGGDIQDLYHSMCEHPGGPNPYADAFFEREYRLDYLMHTYPKPIVALAQGFVMGGGLGVMAASSHRVGTEQSRVAMPEITIGLFPDAGATWFLAHMPAHLAYFLAWTGSHLNAVDARRAGLVDAVIHASDRSALVDELVEASWSGDSEENRRLVGRVIQGFAAPDADMPASEIEPREAAIREMIDACLKADNPAAAFGARISTVDADDKWLGRAAQTFRTGSPTTAQIIHEQITRARGLNLKQTFMLELVIAVQCSRHPDFVEGIRARLIDRDNQPAWKYPDVAKVPQAYIEAHFKSPFAAENPLADLEESGGNHG